MNQICHRVKYGIDNAIQIYHITDGIRVNVSIKLYPSQVSAKTVGFGLKNRKMKEEIIMEEKIFQQSFIFYFRCMITTQKRRKAIRKMWQVREMEEMYEKHTG